MDLFFSAEQERFRQEVRELLGSEEVQASLAVGSKAGPRQAVHPAEAYRRLGERGWLAANWPVEYGGLGKTLVEAAIVAEEMGRAGVSDLVYTTSIMIVGLILVLFGTEEQKARYLPGMARGELAACVLYTEPDCGSDLGALETRAVADGDGYLIYGTKTYTQVTEFASVGLTAVRTRGGQNKYDGITLILVPLDAPGVEVRPLWNLSDDRFSEVNFDGAWVGRESIVGNLHEGWDLIDSALAVERTGLDYYARSRRWLDKIIDRARALGRLSDPGIGHRLAALDAEVEAGRMMVWNMVSQIARGEVDNVEAAMAKWYTTEVGRRIARLALDLERLPGTLSRWDGEAPAGGAFEAAYRDCPGMTLSAGTSEIMLYTISVAGLEILE